MLGLSCGTPPPEREDSVVVVQGLSCPVACGVLVPRPGIKLTFLTLGDRLLTTGPPGKSLCKCVYDVCGGRWVDFTMGYDPT